MNRIVLIGKLRRGILGALNGALFSAVMSVIVWQWSAYEHERNIREAARFGDFPAQQSSNVRWVSVVLIWILAFTLAAFVVDYFWRNRRSGSVLFWEVVGVIAVSAWNVFALCSSWLDKYLAGDSMSYAWVTSSRNPLVGPISLVVVILVNFVYAYLVRAFEPKMYDGKQMDLRSAP